MHRFDNFKIKTKILMGYSSIIMAIIIMAVYFGYTLKVINNRYNNLLDTSVRISSIASNMEGDLSDCRRLAILLTYEANTHEEQAAIYDRFNQTINSFKQKGLSINALIDGDSKRTKAKKDALISEMNTIMDIIIYDYKNEVDNLYVAVSENDAAKTNDSIAECSVLALHVNDLLDTLIEDMFAVNDATSQNAQTMIRKTLISGLILTVVIIIYAIFTASFISNKINHSIDKLASSAKKIATGELKTQIRMTSTDEIGVLSNDVADMADIFLLLVEEIHIAHDSLKAGNINVSVDKEVFLGDYKMAAHSINETIQYLSSIIDDIVDCMGCYANGDMSKEIIDLPGEQNLLTRHVSYLRQNILKVENDIHSLIRDVKEGDLSATIGTEAYSGIWKELAVSLNELIDTVEVPISEVSSVLEKVAQANFDVLVQGDYLGAFCTMKNDVNNTIESLKNYIVDISDILVKMSNKDLNITITAHYKGEFESIQKALTQIIDTFNILISEFNTSAEQVALGAQQISQSSMSLAQGATQQTDSLSEMSKEMKTIEDQTSVNAKNSENANSLSIDTMAKSQENKSIMNEMLESMNSIEKASIEVSGIIQVIEDISFQTKILALNATVEAARAGVHGNGFSVVAQEVRNLANKCQDAASSTNELINRTIHMISDGTKMANSASDTLNEVVAQVETVTAIVEDITQSSQKQHLAIRHVNDNFSQIYSVIQSNSAMSEQCASASQQLSSQADVFKNNIGQFSLNTNYKHLLQQ